MINSTNSFGIVPEDLLIAGAIASAIEDIRAKPYLLDYCFNWFNSDPATNKLYGAKEKLTAKQWFLKSEIYISMTTRIDDVKFPLISIELQSSEEDYATLGDVDEHVFEDVDPKEVAMQPQIVLGPFTPLSYDPDTGLVTLPSNLSTNDVFDGMFIVDPVNNQAYMINEVIDNTSFKIDEDISANFTNAYISPVSSFLVAELGSVKFRNTWAIKCFAQNEPRYLAYLTALVKFILLRYKETLLERRGLDRSTIKVQNPYYANQVLGQDQSTEVFFGQNIILSGIVTEYYPATISEKIGGIKLNGIKYISDSVTPPAFEEEVQNQGWWSSSDFQDEED